MISHEGKLYFPHKNEVARALDELVTFIGFPNVLHKPFLWLGIMVKTFVFSHSLKKESNMLTFDQRGADIKAFRELTMRRKEEQLAKTATNLVHPSEEN